MSSLSGQVSAAMQRGDVAAAEALCTQALSRDKRDAEAMFLLARVLMTVGRHDEARARLEACVKLQPKVLEVHHALAEVLANLGRNQAALQRCDRMLRQFPDSLVAIHAKARMLARNGQHAKTRALLEPVVTRGDETAAMAELHADSLRRDGDADAAVELIERHLGGAAATTLERSQLQFLLGRILETREDYDAAFAAYAKANAEVALPDDPRRYRMYVDALIETFSVDNLARMPRATHGREDPVLVIGMPRTGSTLVEQIIGAHPRAHPAGETQSLPLTLRDLPTRIGSMQPWPMCSTDLRPEHVEMLGLAYVEALRDGAPVSVTRVVDKLLDNYERLGLLTLLTPRARIIDCRRRALDTCWSCFAEPLRADLHPWASRLETIGEHYRQYTRLMDYWHETLGHEVLTVHYEDLVADQETVSRRLVDFAGLEWDDRCLRFHELKREAKTLSREQVKRPLYNSSVNRADRFAAHLGPLKDALVP